MDTYIKLETIICVRTNIIYMIRIHQCISHIYLLIMHTKLTIEGNAQYILTTQHNIKVKALNIYIYIIRINFHPYIYIFIRNICT